MYQLKTKQNDASVKVFIDKIKLPQKREDANRLLDIFSEATGLEANMWSESIIGFGSYHYKYGSGHEGDAALTGFSPRKAKITLYCLLDETHREELLAKLGKHTLGKACIYISKVDDIDTEILKKIIQRSVAYVRGLYPE